MLSVQKALDISKETFNLSFKKVVLSCYLDNVNFIYIDGDKVYYDDYCLDDCLILYMCGEEIARIDDLESDKVLELSDEILILTAK
ncbi:MAG: hypothetical protein J6D47_01610 [Peptostreptococcaceae bacterium]|nr:hypothetical protein [Peptostreptococcaceae bacterium]